MIQVTIKLKEIEILGHAEYAPKGKDIVCASVSVLVQNFIQSIETFTHDTISYDMKPGAVHIHFKSNLSDSAQVLKDSFILGVQSIADEYPSHVHIDQALKSIKAMDKSQA